MAKKAESTLKNMLLSLTAIALVAALALAALNFVTKKPIADAQQKKVTDAISAVLPPFETLKDQTVDGLACHAAYAADGSFVGAAIEAGNDKGFGGHLQLMVGFDANGVVSGYQILETHETPGLGAKADQWFQQGSKGCIVGKNPAESNLTVSKDGGDVDAITGSTITSRAFLGIVNEASATFQNIEK
jgi:electron transport complex protein RnfG